jgi:hypothetical protein
MIQFWQNSKQQCLDYLTRVSSSSPSSSSFGGAADPSCLGGKLLAQTESGVCERYASLWK